MPPFVRPFLAVSQTLLSNPVTGERYPFQGLFTVRDLPKGAFLGFYNGTWKEGLYRGKDSYTFSTSTAYVRPNKRKGGVVDPYEHPLAMCNEPPFGTQATVVAIEFSRAKDVLPQLPSKTEVAALGFYTCTPVKAGSELYLHYGPRFHRGNYPGDETKVVGTPCKILKADRETPLEMMRKNGIHPLVPKECFLEFE